MEFSIPLKDASCPRVPLSVGFDGRCELPPSDDCRVIHNGAGWMCVFDSVRAVLCEVSCDDCVLLGSFFFRARGDSHIFSCVCAGQVYDFSDGDTSADAKLSEDYGVLFSSDDFIDNVSFSSKGLVICTRGGYFGCASLSAHLVGFFHQPVKGASQYRWCAHGDLCACITPQCIFIHALLGGGALQSYRVEKDFSGIGPISSVALVVDTFKGVICLLVNFINSREVLILRITETHEVDSGTNALLVSYAVDRSVFSDSRPTTCVKELEGSHIVATVFPDCVSCAWFAGSDIHQSTIVHNDLPLPFACANWCQPAANGNRLAVLRSDAVCLVYHVNASVDRRIVGDIFLAASISMPLPHGCIMPTGRGLCEHLWVLSGCDFFDVGERNSSIFRQHDDGSFHRVNLHGGVESMGTTFLLDIVPTKEASWFVHMSSDGVCSLTSYGQQGRLCLVKDLDAQQVTSCIAFDLSGKVYCALGFVNGDVQIFADSELRSHVRMAHRGCVDRLIHRHFGGSAGAVMLISAATHLGSICLHKFDTADILCTLQSPATPLTGCFVDAIGEYIFTYSGATGNVWHIPTGRLERAFICYSGVNVSTENLLTESWLSALRIDHQKCFGGRYFAIKVNVMRLIEDLRSRSSVPSDYPAAVNLLYRACDTPMQHLIFEQGPWSRLIDDLNLDVSLCGNVAVLLQAIFMTCALLDVTRNGSLALKAARSSIRLHSVVVQRVETETIALDEVLEEYFLLLFEYGEAFSAAIHAGLAFFVENVRFSLLTEALVLFLSSVSVSSSENRSPASDDSLNLAMTYVLMGFASARQCREWPSSMLQVVLENAASDLKHLTSLLLAGDVSFGRDTKGQRQLIAVCLGYPLLHTIEEYDTFVHNLVRACFGTDDGFAQSSCADALQLIASHNMENFLRAIFLRYFENGSWRASMITFLARCVAQYPWQAYTSVSVIAEILLRAMNSQSHEKTFKLACAAAGTHLLQACVNVLPNVSFHQHQQHLAVGMNDGSVSVFDVRAGTLVNRFRAHSHPVLMVAFSSSSSTESSKLATVSERMSSVSLWASTRSSSILNLFSSSASEFRKDKSMSIPEITVREEDLPNVAHCCVLKWLSSQCVELSTPWHNTLEFALA